MRSRTDAAVFKWQITETQIERSASSRAAGTVGLQASDRNLMRDISTVGNGTSNRSVISIVHCIETSGRPRTGPFPTAVISTMQTETGITTTSRILSALPNRSTTACTERTPSSSARCDNGITARVRNYGRLHKQLFSVQSYTPASGAEGRSSQRVSRPSSAGAPSACGADVPRGQGLSVPVYDLTVEGEHEFFANDLLVHNSSENKDAAFTAGVLMQSTKDGTAEFNRISAAVHRVVRCSGQRRAVREDHVRQIARPLG